MDKKTLFKRLRHFIYIVLITSFLVIYIASENGYFDEIKNKRVVLTNEQIQKFEQDISDGKEIDIKDYYVEEKNAYINKFTQLGSFLSTKIEKLVSSFLDKTFKALNDFLNS